MPGFIVLVIIVLAVYFVVCRKKCGICSNGGDLKPLPDSFRGIAQSHRPFNNKTSDFYCSSCAPKVAEQEKLVLAARNHDPVQTWPATYKGRIPVVAGSEQHRVYSDWYKEKEIAKSQLLLTCVYLFDRTNAVKEIEFDRKTDSEGNYQFTVWRASGIPCNVL